MLLHNRTPLILVVDDDLTTNRMIQSILKRAGFLTASAMNAAEALTGVKIHHPDMVLLDISLPDGNGIDVCRQIQSEPGSYQMPVLFISSYGDISIKVECFDAGGVDYITKPIAAAEVIARVRTHLRLKQAYESLAELQAEKIQRLATAQEAIMPVSADIPHAAFHVFLRQSHMAGGDFYDVIPIGEQVIDYLVADVSGHDLAASFWTAALKALLGEYSSPINTPKDILRSVNAALCRMLPDDVYFTLVHARLARNSKTLALSSAGHPPAIVIPRDGSTPLVIHQEGDVLGAFSNATFDTIEIPVHSGDRFLLYTDGLIELDGARKNGICRLCNACLDCRNRTMPEMIDILVHRMISGYPTPDDIVLLGVDV